MEETKPCPDMPDYAAALDSLTEWRISRATGNLDLENQKAHTMLKKVSAFLIYASAENDRLTNNLQLEIKNLDRALDDNSALRAEISRLKQQQPERLTVEKFSPREFSVWLWPYLNHGAHVLTVHVLLAESFKNRFKSGLIITDEGE